MGELGMAVPKSMLPVGDRPLLVHVMQLIARHGSNQFVLPVGRLGQPVRDYFLRYEPHGGTFTVQLGRQPMVHYLGELPEEGWTVTCARTGERAGTASQLLSAAPYVPNWPAVVGYGDVLADVDLGDLTRYHRGHGRLATMAVAPPFRPGRVCVTDDDRVHRFEDPWHAQAGLVGIGLFVFERAVLDRYIPAGVDVMLEEEPIRQLAADGELMAYRHTGYWQPVDTARDLAGVRRAWETGGRPWGEAPHLAGDGAVVASAIAASSVAADTAVMGDSMAGAAVAGRPWPPDDDPLGRLTRRELEVATLVSEGHTNRTVARRLRVAEKTVEMHLSKVFTKLGVLSRTELAGAMIRASWVRPLPGLESAPR
jgi:glucose-1-phosphate cytidylyltransferase